MLKRQIKKLYNTHNSLSRIIQQIETDLKCKIEFKGFSVQFQSGDGYVLEYEEHNAPLSDCILIIEKKGALSLNDYMAARI